MALYNVPLEDPEHAVKAVRTALEFQERTLAVSKRWEEKLGIAIRNGVGINTGEAVVGTLGSRQLLQYTAIGDTINLGARLESITKDYKTNIIISESTYVLVKGQFVTKELGDVTVKGKSQPVKIYAVLPDNIREHPRADVVGQDGVDLHRLALALHGDVAELLGHELALHQHVGGLADDDVGLVVLGDRLQPRAEVDGVADGRVLQELPGAQRAHHRLARVDPDAVADGDAELLLP